MFWERDPAGQGVRDGPRPNGGKVEINHMKREIYIMER
jgi:hypothetical protein